MDPNTNMIEVKVHYGSALGDYGLNTLFYLPDVTPTGSPFDQAKALVNAWITSNLPAYLAALSNLISVIAVTGRVIGPAGGPSYEVGNGSVGSEGAMQLTFADCALIRYFGGGTGKEEVKTYIPGVPVGSWVNELPIGSYITLINAIITAETTPIPASGTQYTRAGWKRSTGVPFQVNEGTLRSKICFLRRRLLPLFSL